MRHPNPLPPPDAVAPAVRGRGRSRGDMELPPVDKQRFYAFLDHHINADPRSLESEFLRFVRDGDVSRLKWRVQGMGRHERAQLSNICIGHFGLLHVASHLSNVEICKFLVEELEFDINAGGIAGITPLNCSALFGEEGVTEYLLKNGADPNKNEETGCGPLHNAAQNGNGEVVRLLLSGGARVDKAVAHGTPLHIAASHGNTEALKILLDRHSNPNHVSEISGTPLVTALYSTRCGLMESNSLDCVKLLVKAGADVNAAYPKTALVVASLCGLTDCIKYLLEAGADANIPDKQGLLPVEIAASMGSIINVELLLPHTSPITAVPQWTTEGLIAHHKSMHKLHKKSSSTSVRRATFGAEDAFFDYREEDIYTPQQKRNKTSTNNRHSSPRRRSHSVFSTRTSHSAQSRGEKSRFATRKLKKCRRMLEYGFSSDDSDGGDNCSASAAARLGIVSLQEYVVKRKGKLTRSIAIPFQNQIRVLTRSGTKIILRRCFIAVAKRHARGKVMGGLFSSTNFLVDLLDFSVNLQDVAELLCTDSGSETDWLQFVHMIKQEVFAGEVVPDDVLYWLQKIVDDKEPWDPSLLATHIYMVDARQAYGMFMVFSSTIHGLRKNKTDKYLSLRYWEAFQQYDDWKRDFRFSLLTETSTRVNPDTGVGYEPNVMGLTWCIRCCWQHLAHKFPHLMIAALLGEEIRDLLPELQKGLHDLGLREFTSKYMA